MDNLDKNSLAVPTEDSYKEELRNNYPNESAAITLTLMNKLTFYDYILSLSNSYIKLINIVSVHFRFVFNILSILIPRKLGYSKVQKSKKLKTGT